MNQFAISYSLITATPAQLTEAALKTVKRVRNMNKRGYSCIALDNPNFDSM